MCSPPRPPRPHGRAGWGEAAHVTKLTRLDLRRDEGGPELMVAEARDGLGTRRCS